MRSPKEAIALGLKALTLFGIQGHADMGKWAGRDGVDQGQTPDRTRSGSNRWWTCRSLTIRSLKTCLELHLRHWAPRPTTEPESLMPSWCSKACGSCCGLNRRRCAMPPAGLISPWRRSFKPSWAIMPWATVWEKRPFKLNERFDNRKTAGMVQHTFAFFIQHWKRHARHNLDFYRQGLSTCPSTPAISSYAGAQRQLRRPTAAS